jgi:hypothetical protein
MKCSESVESVCPSLPAQSHPLDPYPGMSLRFKSSSKTHFNIIPHLDAGFLQELCMLLKTKYYVWAIFKPLVCHKLYFDYTFLN